MFSNKLSFLAVMGLGNAVHSRHAPLDDSEKTSYTSENKKGLIHFGYEEIHKRGNSSDKLDMIFPISVEFMKERKRLFKI